MVDKTQNIWNYRYDAKWRLLHAVEYGGCSRSDLLGSQARRPIIKSLAAHSVARDVFGMRQASMRDRWRELVELAADNAWALGFRKVDGALRGLAVDTDTCFSTLSRNLTAWENRHPPLVMTGYGKRTKARAPLVLIHIPLLTQWLLWTAEARSYVFAQVPRVIDLEAIRGIACELIPLGVPPPLTSAVTWPEANRILRNAKT